MEEIHYASFSVPVLKRVFIASTKKGVCRMSFNTTEKKFLAELGKQVTGKIVKDRRPHGKVFSQLKRYLEGRLKHFDCPLDVEGTPFQKRVWSALAKIPYGETRSYKDIAKAVGRPKAFRAVGGANGANPVPIIVPCHRVIESTGGLGGYGEGIGMKRRLLDLEKAHGV
jgi:methylated-DNA-[protein]-cysteine S-methyltransferase